MIILIMHLFSHSVIHTGLIQDCTSFAGFRVLQLKFTTNLEDLVK